MNLRDSRKEAGLTQTALSELCECARTTICMIENGKLLPSVKLAKKIGDVLGFDWTLFYEDIKLRNQGGNHEENYASHDGRGTGSTGADD